MEETRPSPALLPTPAGHRAIVRAIAADIGADIQPVQNLRVLKRVMGFFEGDEKTKHKLSWGKHWIDNGFKGVEARLKKTAGKYCFGDTITIADAFLVPQVYNARRFKVCAPPRYVMSCCVHALCWLCCVSMRVCVPASVPRTHPWRPQVDMTQFPTITRVAEALEALPEFKAAAPSSMPDAA